VIELYSRTFQLQASDGKTLLCDPDQLQEDLRSAFRGAGIRESWPADQVLAAIQAQATVVDAFTEDEEEEAFDRLVAKLLTDAGYPDVAAHYGEGRGIASMRSTGEEDHLPWDAARLSELIRANLGASAALCSKLSELVGAKLRALGFREVGNSLILQIAEHTLNGLAQAYRSVPGESSGWLMPPGYWEAFFTGAPARLVASGALKIHPVSDLFPVLRITVDAGIAMSEPVLPVADEDAFVDRWEMCSDMIVDAVSALVQETGPIVDRNRAHPLLMSVKRLDNAIAAAAGRIGKRKRKTLADEAVRSLAKALKHRSVNAIISIAD